MFVDLLSCSNWKQLSTPLSSLLPHELFVDTRFVERPAPPLSKHFAPNTPVVSVAAGTNHYGLVGRVIAVDVTKGSVKCEFSHRPPGESMVSLFVFIFFCLLVFVDSFKSNRTFKFSEKNVGGNRHNESLRRRARACSTCT